MSKGGIPSMVVRVRSKDGRIDSGWAGGIAQPGVPMTLDSPYFLASISKLYTNAVIMKRVQQGRLDLDQAISTYLPADLIDGIHVYKGTDYSPQIKVYQRVNQTTAQRKPFQLLPQIVNALDA